MLTQAWATVIQGALTMAGAIAGVLIAARAFAGQVKDLRSARDASRAAIDEHVEAVEVRLARMEAGFVATFDAIDVQLGANLESVGAIRGSVDDIGDRIALPDAADGPPSAAETSGRATLSAAWDAIRDRLEAIATAPDVDGRSRAAFARIDRRSYYDLIWELDQRALLGGRRAAFEEAAGLWYSNRRRYAGPEATARMLALRDQLVPPA